MARDWLYGPEATRGRIIDLDTAKQILAMMRREAKGYPRFDPQFVVPATDGNSVWTVIPDDAFDTESDANLARIHIRAEHYPDPSLARPIYKPGHDPDLGVVDLNIATGEFFQTSHTTVAKPVILIGNQIGPMLADAPPRIWPAAIRNALARALLSAIPWLALLALAGLWVWVLLTTPMTTALAVLGSVVALLLVPVAHLLARRIPKPTLEATQRGHKLVRLTRKDRALNRRWWRGYGLGILSGIVVVVVAGLILAAFGIGIPITPN